MDGYGTTMHEEMGEGQLDHIVVKQHSFWIPANLIQVKIAWFGKGIAYSLLIDNKFLSNSSKM